MNYNIYMKSYDNKWLVVPFGKPFASFEAALTELKKQAKKVKVVKADEWGIHEGADHSKTGLLTGEPSYINGK